MSVFKVGQRWVGFEVVAVDDTAVTVRRPYTTYRGEAGHYYVHRYDRLEMERLVDLDFLLYDPDSLDLTPPDLPAPYYLGGCI